MFAPITLLDLVFHLMCLAGHLRRSDTLEVCPHIFTDGKEGAKGHFRGDIGPLGAMRGMLRSEEHFSNAMYDDARDDQYA